MTKLIFQHKKKIQLKTTRKDERVTFANYQDRATLSLINPSHCRHSFWTSFDASTLITRCTRRQKCPFAKIYVQNENLKETRTRKFIPHFSVVPSASANQFCALSTLKSLLRDWGGGGVVPIISSFWTFFWKIPFQRKCYSKTKINNLHKTPTIQNMLFQNDPRDQRKTNNALLQDIYDN